MENVETWVLVVGHINGTNVSVHSTHSKARDQLYNYCSEYWSQDVTEKYGKFEKFNKPQAIEAYFEYSQEYSGAEWYLLEKQEIDKPPS